MGAGAAISAFITSLGIGNRKGIPLGYLLAILGLDNAITSIGRTKIPTQMIGALIELSPRAGASRRPFGTTPWAPCHHRRVTPA